MQFEVQYERGVDLVHTLAEILSRPPASVEILPGGLEDWTPSEIKGISRPTTDFPFLLIEGNLGIPKKVLYVLYMTALVMLSSKPPPERSQAASSVILLVNPAHQTALNSRKRLIQKGSLSPEKELEITAVLFQASRDCAKQSILWDHRRWIFMRTYAQANPLEYQRTPIHPVRGWATIEDLQTLPNITPDDIQKEFELVRQACEAYPRNYHAWTHWHHIMDIVHHSLYAYEDHFQDYLDIIIHEHILLRRWVDLHISDHSAIHHLCNLDRLIRDLVSCDVLHYKTALSTMANAISSETLVEHALSLVTSYPSHETLWMYLREASEMLSADQRRDLVDRIKSGHISRCPQVSRFLGWFAQDGTLYNSNSLGPRQFLSKGQRF